MSKLEWTDLLADTSNSLLQLLSSFLSKIQKETNKPSIKNKKNIVAIFKPIVSFTIWAGSGCSWNKNA